MLTSNACQSYSQSSSTALLLLSIGDWPTKQPPPPPSGVEYSCAVDSTHLRV